MIISYNFAEGACSKTNLRTKLCLAQQFLKSFWNESLKTALISDLLFYMTPLAIHLVKFTERAYSDVE